MPGCNKTLAEKGCKTISIAGTTGNRMMTATFAITLSGNTYQSSSFMVVKHTKALMNFLPEFVLSASEKHYSSEKRSLKMLEKIIIPYVKKERSFVDLDICHPALLIMDVFIG